MPYYDVNYHKIFKGFGIINISENMDKKKLLVGLTLAAVIAAAATYTLSQNISITAKEPLELSIGPTEFELYPGEEAIVKVSITNKAPVDYGLIVATTGDVTDGPCVWQGYAGVEGDVTEFDVANGKFNIAASGSGAVDYKIKLPEDADGSATCTVSIAVDITRGAVWS